MNLKTKILTIIVVTTFSRSYAQFIVADPTVDASIASLNIAVNSQLSVLNNQAAASQGTLSSISSSSAKGTASLAQVVQRQNEIRMGLRNPATIMKFDIALKLIKMINDIRCTNANLPKLIKQTGALNFCGFSLKYNTVSVQLNSAAQFLQLAISVQEITSGERAQNLRVAFEYFQSASFSYLSLTRLLQKQVDDNTRLNNRRRDNSALLRRAF